jgi:hypothetical protein
LERHVEQSPTVEQALPLPAVIPLVLHHSNASWSAARRLEDLFDAELLAEPELSALIPRLSFVLDDISQLSDEALESRALELLPALTLWALRDVRNPKRFRRSVERWASAMAQLLAAPNGREALRTIFRYISLVADDTVAATLSDAVQAAQPQVKEALMTLAEKWMAEGEARGKAEVLRKLLALKFGELPEVAQLRIARATEADLDRWAARVLSTETLAGVIEP